MILKNSPRRKNFLSLKLNQKFDNEIQRTLF